MSARLRQVNIRLTTEDETFLQRVREKSGRSASDVLRLALHAIDLDKVNTGVTLLPTQIAGGSRTELEGSRERETSAA